MRPACSSWAWQTCPFTRCPSSALALALTPQSAAGAASSVTGVKALLAAQGVMVSTQEIADGGCLLVLVAWRGQGASPPWAGYPAPPPRPKRSSLPLLPTAPRCRSAQGAGGRRRAHAGRRGVLPHPLRGRSLATCVKPRGSARVAGPSVVFARTRAGWALAPPNNQPELCCSDPLSLCVFPARGGGGRRTGARPALAARR